MDWKAGVARTYSDPGCSFSLDDGLLYDDVCDSVRSAEMPGAVSRRYSIFSPEIPAHHYFPLSLRAGSLLPFALRNKIAMMYSDGRSTSGKAAGIAEKGWYTAKVRGFGDYWLAVDTSAPIVKSLTALKGHLGKSKSIAFRATDNFTSVQAFRGELNGKWILFEQHGSTWTYVLDEHCPKGPHKLVIKAKDENGNEARASFTFTR